jgi:hypothetical protein
MIRKLLKTIKYYLKNSGFWRNILDQNMTFVRKPIIILTSCNITFFIVYMPVLDSYFI